MLSSGLLHMIAKSLILWAAIIPLAIANGAFRDAVLVPRLGPAGARFASGLMLSALILALAVISVPWIGRGSAHQYWSIGAVWLVFTVAFEFVFGRFVAKKPWPELIRAYTFENGDIWPLVLVIVAAAPYLAARVRGMI
jgi:hypothetical protein